MKINPQNLRKKNSEIQKSLLSVIKKPRIERRGDLNVLTTVNAFNNFLLLSIYLIKFNQSIGMNTV